MRLINQHTVAQAYTSTLSPLYNAEIAPYITFGDLRKLCIVLFENNTTTLSSPINCVFFSLGVDVTSVSSSAKNGGMIRANYANIRDLDITNDARCSAETIVKIYELDI